MTLFGPVVEAGHEGPYTRWYLMKKRDQALHAHLIGRPTEDVEQVLGRADAFRYRPSGPLGAPPYIRIDYRPYPWVPVSFQVYCHNGVVTTLKMNDDTVN